MDGMGQAGQPAVVAGVTSKLNVAGAASGDSSPGAASHPPGHALSSPSRLSLPPLQDKETGSMVTFCTGVRAGDTLMPMWCGTDYENENSRKCASYFNMLYEVRRGVPSMP